ncbi:hypothetical protein [Xylella fastidiosa]|uniref:Uncharacterized protein n=2 Tax=Xylella fastidiosa TaxID=2371 RepID=A0A060H8R8_XYLFS|nr:hypothetical protein [Xylella fastidiosa]AIC11730.1 hypothetical protein D934_13880 [Xylella fastidiosa subsp. sandyi Ann-1]UIX82652.1 hypothetical protein LZ756_13300 [Xylella fastidiosa subsp. sandyi]
MAMDGNFREENLLFKLLKSDKRLWILAIMVALIGTINAEQKADDTQPFKATKAVEAPSTSTAKDFPVKERVDRMAILVHQRNEIFSKLKYFETSGDEASLERIQSELRSIDREISLISDARNEDTDSIYNGNKESKQSKSEEITYKSWDIFKNFGLKGN